MVQGSFHGFARLVHFRYYNGYFEATICGTEHCFVLLEILFSFSVRFISDGTCRSLVDPLRPHYVAQCYLTLLHSQLQ